MQSDLLRLGVQHRRTSRQHLHQHVHLWSRRDPGVHSVHARDGLETNGSQVDGLHWTAYIGSLQYSLHPDGDIRSARFTFTFTFFFSL